MILQRRFADWPSRLDSFLRLHRQRRFVYGEWDCCLFVAGAIEAMTGADLAASFRETYHSRKEARERYGSVRAISDQVFAEWPRVSVLKAQRGDVVLVQRCRDYSLGLVSLTGKHILAAARQGFYRLSLERGLYAWHV